jgi:hypothetical protein
MRIINLALLPILALALILPACSLDWAYANTKNNVVVLNNSSSASPNVSQSVPISFRGMGQQASPFFTLKPGLAIFKMTHDGESNFDIWLLDSKGNKVELLVNEIGTFNGSKAVGIKEGGTYILDIDADGNWKIDITQPSL